MEKIITIIGRIDERMVTINNFYDELRLKHPKLTEEMAKTVSEWAISMYENELLFLTLLSSELKKIVDEKEKGTTQV